jgi:hypothetical protein
LTKVKLPHKVGWLGEVKKNHIIRINKSSARASWHRVKHLFIDQNKNYHIQVKSFGPDYVRFNPMPVLEKTPEGAYTERFVLVENCPYKMNIKKTANYEYVPPRISHKKFQTI